MDFRELLRVALTSIRVHSLRSLLTILGIMIGVGSVVTMTTVTAGAQNEISETMKKLGSTLMYVYAGSRRSRGVSSASGTEARLTEGDADALKREIPEIVAAAPYMDGFAQVIFGNQNWNSEVVASDADYLVARSWSVESGRDIDPVEYNRGAKVALLGVTVVENLFGESDPVGQTIRINNVRFKVVGVLEEKGASTRRDMDDVVVVPLKAARLRLLGRRGVGGDGVEGMYVTVASEELMDYVGSMIQEVLRQRHRVPEDQEAFRVRNLTEMIEADLESRNTLNSLLIAVASVSLLVGGINIMNMMLVTVTERTREIGLRMAVGAKSSHILSQFLFEAVTLCSAGGAIGILFAIGASWICSATLGWPVLMQWYVLFAAVVFSALIGVFFGFYPAKLASRKDPIEALRAE